MRRAAAVSPDEGRIKRTLSWLVRIADPLSKWAGIVAVAGGALWTYRLFVEEDTHEARPQINVTAESIPYASDSRLLLVNISIRNLGKVRVSLGKNHFWIVVKKYPRILALEMSISAPSVTRTK